MSITEIVLIISGVIIFALGYLLPVRRKDMDEDVQLISEDQVRKVVDREVEGVKEHISDIVDETITYAMEKTERSMERVANEKIMAVNEYSDTVLEDINKNHKEVLFLYDMLNDKHDDLKTMVSEAEKTADEVKQTLKDAEITAREAKTTAVNAMDTMRETENGFVPIAPPKVEIVHNADGDYVAGGEWPESRIEPPEGIEEMPGLPKWSGWANRESVETELAEAGTEEFSAVNGNDNGGSDRNSNDRILELHKAGKSNMMIAKELGLGIGEVKLVIDLFEGL